MHREIFHLAFPVRDLDVTPEFYVNAFDARIGRTTEAWIDLIVWGHQLTLHLAPAEVLDPAQRGVRHFGVVLNWGDWERCCARLQQQRVRFLMPPELRQVGTPLEHGKLLVEDPSGNVLEIKTYRDLGATFGLSP
jgi:extradiol dioxygenase family protein